MAAGVKLAWPFCTATAAPLTVRRVVVIGASPWAVMASATAAPTAALGGVAVRVTAGGLREVPRAVSVSARGLPKPRASLAFSSSW